MMSRRGFTLIEILVVIVIIGVLSIMGVGKYTEFTTQSRGSACVSNKNAIDKTIGVWESQNVAIPSSVAADVTFDTNGKIAASAGLTKLAVPATESLATVGSAVVINMTKDENVFVCPERANVVGLAAIHTGKTVENDYKWQIVLAAVPALNNKTRGTECLHYGNTGPDNTTNTLHR
jgi:prepilin-type N-terminal cleavage/methylation domain-containing protein